LFLLSLVDTIECTKRFEKLYWIDGCSKPISLPIKHVLDNVQIQLNDDGIIIDYSSLSSVIKNYCSLFNSKKKKAALRVELDKQMSSVIGLKDWVNCETIYVGPLITKIVF